MFPTSTNGKVFFTDNGVNYVDLGAAVVSPSGGQTLTQAVGGRSLAFNYAGSQRYNSFGYPAGSPFNGQRLWKCDSSLYMSDSSTDPQTMGIRCNMTGGSSGGGWVGASDPLARVYSVNSYGYRSLRNVMFGPYQGDLAEQLFATAAAG